MPDHVLIADTEVTAEDRVDFYRGLISSVLRELQDHRRAVLSATSDVERRRADEKLWKPLGVADHDWVEGPRPFNFYRTVTCRQCGTTHSIPPGMARPDPATCPRSPRTQRP